MIEEIFKTDNIAILISVGAVIALWRQNIGLNKKIDSLTERLNQAENQLNYLEGQESIETKINEGFIKLADNLNKVLTLVEK